MKVKMAAVTACVWDSGGERQKPVLWGRGAGIRNRLQKGLCLLPWPCLATGCRSDTVFPRHRQGLPWGGWISQTFNSAMPKYKGKSTFSFHNTLQNNSKTIQNRKSSRLGDIRPQVKSPINPSSSNFSSDLIGWNLILSSVTMLLNMTYHIETCKSHEMLHK